MFTTAYDCTIRSLSLATGVSREVFSSGEVLITSIDLPPAGHELWASDASGGVTHLDLRQDKSKARWYELSDQKIGSVSINPVNPHLLLTASNNRTLKYVQENVCALLAVSLIMSGPSGCGIPARWQAYRCVDCSLRDPCRTSLIVCLSTRLDQVADNRALDFDSDVIEGLLTSKAGKRTLRSNWPHGKSVSSAYWDPRGRTIVSTSYDDTLRRKSPVPSPSRASLRLADFDVFLFCFVLVWDIKPSMQAKDAGFPVVQPFSKIKHDCQTVHNRTISGCS